MRRLLKIGLILLPIFALPLTINKVHINIRDARELLFQSLTIIALGIIIKNKWIKYFLVWCVVNWWFCFFLPPQSTAVLFNIFFGFFIFYLFKEFVRPEDIDGILKIVCLTALFQIFWLGIQALGWDFIFHRIDTLGRRIDGKPPLIGWLGNSNTLGAYLAFCIVPFRVYYKKLLPLVVVGLVIANSLTAIVSAFCGLVFFELFRAINRGKTKKILLILFICVIFLVLLFIYIGRTGSNGRVELWRKLIVQTLNWRCLIGWGLGRFQTLRVLDKTGTEWSNPHNEFLNVYFELGVVGLVLVFGYLAGLFRRFLKIRNDNKTILLFSCCVVVLVNCLGNFPFQLASTAFLGIIYFALLERLLCQNHQNILLKN